MSFGRPGTYDSFKVSPPARGSFPLDHDGECKAFMMQYMKCIKSNKWDNSACRPESRAYLECRMDKDDFENLGLGDVQSRRLDDPNVGKSSTKITSSSSSSSSSPPPPLPPQQQRETHPDGPHVGISKQFDPKSMPRI